MALTRSSLSSIPISFATVSIGCSDSHTLPKKIDVLAAAGFTGIELGFPDLLSFASQHLRHKVGEKDWSDLKAAARVVKAMTDARGLEIMLLQPFSNFEGWAEGSEEREDAFERARGWIDIMLACGCKTLQVGSSDTPSEKIGTDRNRFVADLQQLCDMLAEHNLRLAYENWAWSSHAPTWSDVWDIIQKVDRPNAGLCLDTFQTAGYEYADPSTPSGLVETVPHSQLLKDFTTSMSKLSTTIPASKIYLLQISDAYKPPSPITTNDSSGLRPRGQWSHDFRPVPFNGGYLPVVEVAKAVLKTGFRGWFSYEVFDGGRDGKGKSYEMEDFAEEARKSHERLVGECVEE